MSEWRYNGVPVLVSEELLKDNCTMLFVGLLERGAEELRMTWELGPKHRPDRGDWFKLQPLPVRRQWKGLPAKHGIKTRRAGDPERGHNYDYSDW